MSLIYYPAARPRFKLQRSLWLVFGCLCLSLFPACHWPLERPAGVDQYNRSQDVIVSDVEAGSAVRQVALCLLGAAGLLSLVALSNSRRFHIDGLLGWSSVSFAAWASLSVVWAEDPALSFKRLISFAIYWVAAAAVVRFLSLHQILDATFFITSLFLVVAIAVEFQSGSFHPFTVGYRFSGTQHPNGEGIECGLLVLSGFAAAKFNRQHRSVYLAGALTGLTFLILTASRTAMAATLAGNAVFLLPTTSPKTRQRIVLGGFALASVVAVIVASIGYHSLELRLFPGRDDAPSGESFAGRTEIWKDVTPFILKHPIIGYGYSGFWTPAHISFISDEEKWGVPDSHSAYVDYTLSLGAIGLSLYVLCLLSGIGRTVREYSATRDSHFMFLAAILSFCLIDGLFESSVEEGSLLTFLSVMALVRLGFYSRRWLDVATIDGRINRQKVVSA
jgi:exopolysaccharide production protein ExoQ